MSGLLMIVLVSCAVGQLYAVETTFGSSTCAGEAFAINANLVTASSPCIQRGCVASPDGRSSYVTCSPTLPVPTSKMTCGYDQSSDRSCGLIVSRARVALGVCARLGSGSVIYQDCDSSGKPTSAVTFTDGSCTNPPASVSTSPVPGRLCLGGTCSEGVAFKCNAVVRIDTPTCFASADLNGDGLVNLIDVVAALQYWGPCGTNYMCLQADQNCDGVIDLLDISQIISKWS